MPKILRVGPGSLLGLGFRPDAQGSLGAEAPLSAEGPQGPELRPIADGEAGGLPGLLLQAIVLRGERTAEGTLIQAVAPPWFEIIALLQKDPSVAYQLSPERWEEMVAGAYQRWGFEEVTLTPRSGDRGRDVIAVKRGFGTVRIVNQVKAFKPSHLVTANDVRALIGVLPFDGSSKGCLTTTSDFAPGVHTDPSITYHMPARLELMNGPALFRQLGVLAGTPDPAKPHGA